LFSAERINFMTDYSDSTMFNNTYSITAHEVAHQWWANKLAPLSVPGRPFLTESLAKYTEHMVTEKRFGKLYLGKYLQTDNGLYFGMRNGGGTPELPLYQTTDQDFVYYQKGGLALYAVKEELGEEQMSRALQRLINAHAFPNKKAAASDLINELYATATPVQVNYIDDFLKKVIVYDNKLQVISCEPLPNGRFEIKLQVNIIKKDQNGQIITPSDAVTLAVFNEPADAWNNQTQPAYLQRHHFSKAVTQLTIVVDKKPAAVAIDPYGYLLDEDLADNVQQVK
jgi:hypothetical protein